MELHMKSKIISLHGKMDILDENDNPVYTIQSKAISIHNKTYIRRATGEDVAEIERKIPSIHDIHIVTMANGLKFQVKTELLHAFQDVLDIVELGWHLHGNLLGHDYQIYDDKGKTIAITHMKWFSIHRISYIDIIEPSQQDIAIALFVALERIIDDREAAGDTIEDAINGANNNNSSN